MHPSNEIRLFEAHRSQGQLMERMMNYIANRPYHGPKTLMDNAISAVTLAHQGRIRCSETLTANARPFYGNALRMLNAALTSDGPGFSDDTLSATVLLSVFEMLSSNISVPWVRHAGGVAALIKIRGPTMHRTGCGRDVFLAYRDTLLHHAFETNSACFLDEPQWRKLSKDIQRDYHASGQVGQNVRFYHSTEMFYAELAKLPAMVRDVRNLPNLVREATIDGKAVIFSLMADIKMLKTKLCNALGKCQNGLEDIGFTIVTEVSNEPIFPAAHHYANSAVGRLYINYYSTSIMINLLLKELEHDTENCAQYDVENEKHAMHCCQSVLYMHQFKFVGTITNAIGLHMSLLVFRDGTRRSWIVQKLHKLGASRAAAAKEIPSHHPDDGIPGLRQAVQRAESMV